MQKEFRKISKSYENANWSVKLGPFASFSSEYNKLVKLTKEQDQSNSNKIEEYKKVIEETISSWIQAKEKK